MNTKLAAAVLIVAVIFGGSIWSSAQEPTQIPPDSVVQIAAEAQGLAVVPVDQLPRYGTFWVVLNDVASPVPVPFLYQDSTNTPVVYSLGVPGQFLEDNTGGMAPQPSWRQAQRGVTSATLLLQQGNAVLDLIAQVWASTNTLTPSPHPVQLARVRQNTAEWNGNVVYLTNLTATLNTNLTMTASVSIAGGTNFVPYDLWTTTNVAASITNYQWNWLGIGYTGNRYTFTNQSANQQFYALAKPQRTMTVAWGADIYGQCDVPFGITNALSVAGSYYQGLALLNNGTVVAWGDDTHTDWVPTNVVGASMIAAGWNHNVALLTNGTVIAWGANLFGVTNVPANLTNATVVSAQALNTLALRQDGTVVAWGDNSFGQTNVPAGLTNVTALAAGGEHSLAVSNGIVVGWGKNNFGQCVAPPGLTNVWDVAASGYHSLALLNNGTVVAWGDNTYGETNVPAGLSNVVAIAAGGDPLLTDGTLGLALPYSLALKSDGTVTGWGAGWVLNPVDGLTNVISVGGGLFQALAVRTGPATPVITQEPTNQYQLPGGTVTFTNRGAGLYGVTYQWQTNGVNLAGATNATLTLTNLQSAQLGSYDVLVTDNAGMGSIVSSNASLSFVTAPVVNSATLPTNQLVLLGNSVTLSVSASAPGQTSGFPLAYQWLFAGTNLAGQTSSNYTFTATNSGAYSVIVTNAAGTVTNVWQVTVLAPGSVVPWGSNPNGELNAPFQLTNAISLAAGKAHGVITLDTGTVTNWGSYWTGTNFVAVSAPPLLTNAIAVAAGSRHDLVLKSDGTIIAWGWNDWGQTNIPPNTTNVVAVAAGGQESLALLQNGTVVQWGQTNAPLPAGLTNVTAIAAGTNFSLALLQNSTVVAWGANNYNQTNIPAGLSNVVAIAAGGAHALALKQSGTVVAWGAWTNVPITLSNVMAVAAGENHSLALLNSSTVTAWGDNTFGQTNVLAGLNAMKLIAGGGDFSLASQFSTFVQYSVDVTRDLLLIYNGNSQDSSNLCAYYLAHRPLVANANVLCVACDVGEFFASMNNCDTQLVAPVLNWLTNNPTKHPQYVVLFYNIPTRITNSYPYSDYGSASYHLRDQYPGFKPFVNNLNAASLADCEAYVNKLASFGTNYSPGKLIISAQGYGNGNYYFDNTGLISILTNVSGLNASNAVVLAGVSSNSVTYTNVRPDINLAGHITTGSNVAGYLSFGEHSSMGEQYSTNGTVKWSGNSNWWLIETIESFNGQRAQVSAMGTFVQWFSPIAFGGTGYSNTPIGAVTHTEEPGEGAVEDCATYFGLWATGKAFAICAWNSRLTPYFQAVGDPLVTK